jgi:hypothetical protein
MMSVESSPRVALAARVNDSAGVSLSALQARLTASSSTSKQGSLDMKPLAIFIAAAIAVASSAAFAQGAGTDAAKGAPAQAGEPAKSQPQSKKKSKKKKQSQQQGAPQTDAK